MNTFSLLEIESAGYNSNYANIITPITAIHYIFDGFGYFNGKKLGKGQFFCTFKNYHVSYYPDSENPWTYCFVRFDCKDIPQFIKQFGMHETEYYGNFDFPDEIKLLCSLYSLHAAKATENKSFMESLGNLLLSLHEKSVDTESPQSATAMHIKQIKQYIDMNYYKKISIAEIAKNCYLSRPYIRNIFQANIGLSPKQYLKKVRMEKAVELLTETNYQIALIAKSVGYEDQLQFSKAFKLTFGMSPSEYRANSQKSGDAPT